VIYKNAERSQKQGICPQRAIRTGYLSGRLLFPIIIMHFDSCTVADSCVWISHSLVSLTAVWVGFEAIKMQEIIRYPISIQRDTVRRYVSLDDTLHLRVLCIFMAKNWHLWANGNAISFSPSTKLSTVLLTIATPSTRSRRYSRKTQCSVHSSWAFSLV
jgi:hypothetical protein